MRGWICWSGVVALSIATAGGCSQAPEPPKPPEVTLGNAESLPSEDEKPDGIRVDQSGEFGKIADLKLSRSGLQFAVPAVWNKVPSPANIVEAEFQLPKVKEDEFDGRLTLMPSGGALEEMIKEWEAEFDDGTRQDSKDESLSLAGKNATWIDRRGVWHGTRHSPTKDPRKNYRMIVVVIPLDEVRSCFIKLTGPQDTVAAHEKEFRTFVNSVKPLEEKK